MYYRTVSVCRSVVNSYFWLAGVVTTFPRLFSKKVEVIRGGTDFNTTGIVDAMRDCPWPGFEGSGSCYAEGAMQSPIGKAAMAIWRPVKCLSMEEGLYDKGVCLLGPKNVERVQVIALFILLFGVWYSTLPKDEKKHENNRRDFF